MQTHTRALTLDLASADDAQRTAPAVLSTEHPVDRGGWLEILSHHPDAVDLSRTPLPLLESHNSSRLNVGVIENVHLAGNKLRGTVRLGESARAREIWSDIKAGVLRSLSIGYQILQAKEHGDTLTATRWLPLECSLVAVPADPNAGLYRGMNMTTEHDTDTDTEIENEHPAAAMPILTRLSRSQKRNALAHVREERQRILTINAIFDHFKLNGPYETAIREEFIHGGQSVESVRDWLRNRTGKPDPVPSVASDYSLAQTQGALTTSAGYERLLRHYGHNPHEARERAYAAGQWIRGALFGNRAAQQWIAGRGMVSYDGSAGGVLVPAELAQAVLSLAEDYGVARAECTIWPMGSAVLTIPRRREGLTAHFLGEVDEATPSQGDWDNINLRAKKLGAFVLLSNELVEDAVIDLAGFLADEIARTFAAKEDTCLFQGDGTSTYGGIVGLEPSILGTASAVAATTGHNTLDEIDAADLRRLMATLPQRARKDAKWYVSPLAKEAVFGRLLDAAGGNTLADLARGGRAQFGGYEIVETEFAPNSTGDLKDRAMLYFGNLRRAAAFGDRREIRAKTDESRFLTSDQTALFATERFDLVVHGIYGNEQPGEILALVGA